MPRLLEDIFQNRYFVLLLELLLVYIFWKLFTRFTRKALEKSKRDNVLIGFVVSAETVFTVFLAIMMMISVVLDTRIVRILGAAGAGVAVLAIILKDAAANVMGGISVLASKKVNLGDRISVANAEEGYVTKIDLMFTTIKGTDSKLVLIPNAKIMSEGFVNYTWADKRRIECVIHVLDGQDIDEVRKILLETAMKEKLVLKSPEPSVAVIGIEKGNAVLKLRVWCSAKQDYELEERLYEKSYKALHGEGIEVL